MHQNCNHSCTISEKGFGYFTIPVFHHSISPTRNQRPIKPNQGKSSPEHFFDWRARHSRDESFFPCALAPLR
jgi:hypothetical protein